MRLVLERLEGVQNAKVQFREKRAVVTYEPTQVTVSQMIEAVAQSGFRAEEVP